MSPRKKSNRDWNPIKAWLLDQITGVGYSPSLRWCFYRCMSFYSLRKKDWAGFKKATARWRKNFETGWKPDTITDSVRDVFFDGFGAISEKRYREMLVADLPNAGVWARLPFYVEIWFESDAMAQQFLKYVGKPYRITLRPFRGDYTIPMKWATAKHLEGIAEAGKKIMILYFGDADQKGEEIPLNALKDIRVWCDGDFEFVNCGLTVEQAKSLKLPENFERPGQWQWDALADAQARKIIEDSLAKHVDLDTLNEAIEKSDKDTKKWAARIKKDMGVG
jgi:hypothetical protein